jgi:hypothetical protein
MYLPLYSTGETTEPHMPFLFHGEMMKSRGWKNPVKLVLMNHNPALSGGYVSSLGEYGYEIHDESQTGERLKRKYRTLSKLPEYLFYTFIRWIVLKKMVDRKRISLPLILIDGDIIFTEDPENVAREVMGKTFILQGNPCFSVISDYRWFEQYETELLRYDSDTEAYNRAAENDTEALCPDREWCNLSLYRFPLRHEQDLQEFLISKRRLIQDRTRDVFAGSSYYWMQNPLFPAQWAREQGVRRSFTIRQKENGYFAGGKKLPFIHFQNSFSAYCRHWLLACKLNYRYFSTYIAQNAPAGTARGPEIETLRAYEDELSKRAEFSRLTVCREAFETNPATGNHFIVDILNSLL